MKVCEIEGRIIGFECSTDSGFLFHGEWINGPISGFHRAEEIHFPYNVKHDSIIHLENLMNKKFKLKIEIVEDEQEKKQKPSD